VDEDRISGPILWLIVTSLIATLFYTVIFSLVREPTPIGTQWALAVIASIFFNWASVYCEKVGGAFNLFASYAAAVAGLVANITFAACAYAMLLGPHSTLYHFLYSPR
jgi:hypothetical protein